MVSETSPLLGDQDGQQARRCYSVALIRIFFSLAPNSQFVVFSALFISSLLIAVQFVFFPGLKRAADNSGAWIYIGFSMTLEKIVDTIWVFITVELDGHIHGTLYRANLDPKQRDGLRKCDSLDTVVRICVTKLSVAIVSLVLAFKLVVGALPAVVLCLVFIAVNLISRRLIRQEKGIEENWEKTVRRNTTFNVHGNTSDGQRYEESQRELKFSRLWRAFRDNGRAIVFIACLISICWYFSDKLPWSMQLGILKDLVSLDGHLDKLSKSLVTAKALINTYYFAQKADLLIEAGGQEDDLEQALAVV